MTLSREYQDKFDSLKHRFNCSNTELEALLRETYKSGRGYSHASLENLIDYQIGQLDAPRRRICQVVYSPMEKRRRMLQEPPNERLSAREIRELFATSLLDVKFSKSVRGKLLDFKQRLQKRRQKLKFRRRAQSLLNRLARETRNEALREGRRQIRGHARRQLKRFLPLY